MRPTASFCGVGCQDLIGMRSVSRSRPNRKLPMKEYLSALYADLHKTRFVRPSGLKETESVLGFYTRGGEIPSVCSVSERAGERDGSIHISLHRLNSSAKILHKLTVWHVHDKPLVLEVTYFIFHPGQYSQMSYKLLYYQRCQNVGN